MNRLLDSLPTPTERSSPKKPLLTAAALTMAMSGVFWGIYVWQWQNPESENQDETVKKIGRVATNGNPLKADTSILHYTIKIPSTHNTTRLTERFMYAKKGRCGKPKPEVGDTVYVTIKKDNSSKLVTSAHTLNGCALHDTGVIKEIHSANLSDTLMAALTCLLATLASLILSFLHPLLRKAQPQP